MRVACLSLLCLVFAAGTLRADEKRLTPHEAATAFVIAFEAGDAKAMKRLAGRENPEPWWVADVLCQRKEFDAAERFARAAPRKAVEKLAAYVTSRRTADDSKARETGSKVAAAWGKRDWAGIVAIVEGAGPLGDSVPGIRALYNRGVAYQQLGRRADSGRAYEQAADAARELGWYKRAEEAYHSGAIQFYELSDWPAAERLWRQRLVFVERLGLVRSEADTLGALGVVRQNQGDFKDALKLHGRALELHEMRKDVVAVAMTHNNLGIVHDLSADYPKALAAYRKTLAAGEQLRNPRLTAYSWNNIGITHQKLGEYADALAAFDHAMPLAAKHRDRMLVAQILNNRGIVRRRLGEFDKALEAYGQAYDAAKALGNLALQAKALQNLGVVHERLGQHREALDAFERALVIRTSVNDLPGLVQTHGNIGLAYASLDQLDEAGKAQERALEVAERIGDGPGRARALGNLAKLESEAGRNERSLELARQTLEQLDETPDPEGRATTLETMASVYLQMQRHGDALKSARAGLDVVERLSRGLADSESATSRDLWANLFVTGMVAAERLDAPVDMADLLERGRAGSLRESLQARGRLWTVLVPPKLRAAERRAHALEMKAQKEYLRAARTKRLKPMRKAKAALAEARAATEAVIARMQREAKAGASIVHTRVDDLDTMRGRLTQGQVLVLYAVAGKVVVALVVRAGGARIVGLGSTKELVEPLGSLRLDDSKSKPDAELAALRRFLVAPLGLTDADRQVLVSPAGDLGLLPFGLLMPDRDLAYVPSGTLLGLLRASDAPGGSKVLALGDPVYTAGRRLAALPETRTEVKAVGDVTLLGERATQAELVETLATHPRWRAVHLACHGLVDPENPLRSSLALTAGADDDGMLTCVDVFRLPLAADLVVLSACETARGRVYKTEGIVGLTRAFLFAGAPRVICSLWKVDDAATRALMTKFYALWNPRAEGATGLTAAAALRAAQAHVRSQDQWKHPYFWAAWVLWGLPD
ncbi:MAG: CHAT domain-containing tetratricopeptide repeat protein [Planctomycetota bacterium]|nr:CHAT domain-containing tetratricopeptide repeat protein [Planctomycetota bacterium]